MESQLLLVLAVYLLNRYESGIDLSLTLSFRGDNSRIFEPLNSAVLGCFHSLY